MFLAILQHLIASSLIDIFCLYEDRITQLFSCKTVFNSNCQFQIFQLGGEKSFNFLTDKKKSLNPSDWCKELRPRGVELMFYFAL